MEDPVLEAISLLMESFLPQMSGSETVRHRICDEFVQFQVDRDIFIDWMKVHPEFKMLKEIKALVLLKNNKNRMIKQFSVDSFITSYLTKPNRHKDSLVREAGRKFGLT
jgi:DNA polymerase I-like protein with 3'-5' exonuclease and polymerase domains